MMCLRVSALWFSIVLLLLVATGTRISGDAQKSYMSDAAMTCKQQYRLQCLLKDRNNPVFKDPICLKFTRHNRLGSYTDYFTYPKGACGLADLCWNPHLSLVKHDVCDITSGMNETRTNCNLKKNTKYQFYRRLAEKLPCPRSGARKVHYLQYCLKPYNCAMKWYGCYGTDLVMPDRNQPERVHFCYKLCVTQPNTNVCAYTIYLTYTRAECIEQDQCWEWNLSTQDDTLDYQKHCSFYAIKRLSGELLRGRVRYDDDSGRPHVFGRGR